MSVKSLPPARLSEQLSSKQCSTCCMSLGQHQALSRLCSVYIWIVLTHLVQKIPILAPDALLTTGPPKAEVEVLRSRQEVLKHGNQRHNTDIAPGPFHLLWLVSHCHDQVVVMITQCC